MAFYFLLVALTVATGRVELNKTENLLMISVKTDTIILQFFKKFWNREKTARDTPSSVFSDSCMHFSLLGT